MDTVEQADNDRLVGTDGPAIGIGDLGMGALDVAYTGLVGR